MLGWLSNTFIWCCTPPLTWDGPHTCGIYLYMRLKFFFFSYRYFCVSFSSHFSFIWKRYIIHLVYVPLISHKVDPTHVRSTYMWEWGNIHQIHSAFFSFIWWEGFEKKNILPRGNEFHGKLGWFGFVLKDNMVKLA